MADVVVVGAGLGGLAAACHLQGRGHQVTVLERDPEPGGRAGTWCRDGFRFDTGPAVLTMREVLADTFAAAGAELEDHLELVRLDPAYRAAFWDGSQIRVRAGREAMADEIRACCGPAEEAAYRRFAAWLDELFRTEFEPFIARDVPSPLALLREPRALASLVRLGGFGRLAPRVASFFTDERLRRLFSFQAMYAGLSPLRALALYAVITHMDTVQGVWFPAGGMHRLAVGLADAAAKAGADLRYGVEVDHVRADTGTGAGVRTATGEWLRADAVVVNPDLPIAYADLLAAPPPRRVARARSSPSCVLWLLGTRGPVPQDVAHHDIHFGAAWSDAFGDLLDRGRPMADPSRFVTVASLTDPSAAPPGHHTLYVLEPVPNLGADLDWAGTEPQLTERTMTWLRTEGYLHGDPVVSRTVTPPDWRACGHARGTPFGLDHRFLQSGPFRPALTDPRLPGVVFVGSSTRPGVGVPMVLLSGRLAADAVEQRRG